MWVSLAISQMAPVVEIAQNVMEHVRLLWEEEDDIMVVYSAWLERMIMVF